MSKKTKKRPCENVKKGLNACFWQEVDVCSCYHPHAKETLSGDRFPELAPISSVPLDFCAENYIPVEGQDQHFQRNTTLLRYRQRKKNAITKKEEREVSLSGSASRSEHGQSKDGQIKLI